MSGARLRGSSPCPPRLPSAARRPTPRWIGRGADMAAPAVGPGRAVESSSGAYATVAAPPAALASAAAPVRVLMSRPRASHFACTNGELGWQRRCRSAAARSLLPAPGQREPHRPRAGPQVTEGGGGRGPQPPVAPDRRDGQRGPRRSDRTRQQMAAGAAVGSRGACNKQMQTEKSSGRGGSRVR